MYMRFILCLIVLYLFASVASECPIIETANGNVNLNPLADENDGKGFSVSSGGWTYTVRMCENFAQVPSCVDKKDVAAYQTPNSGTLCHYMGQFNSRSTFTLTDPTNPEKGVSLMYKDGQVAFDVSRTTQVDLICDSSDSKSFTCGPKGCEEETGSVINYHFVLKTKHACPGSGRPFLFPVGLLGILLILVMFGFLLYWPIGIVVNKFIRKKEGIEIIPNVAFWKDLPFLVKDGFIFLFKELCYEKVILTIVNKIRKKPEYEAA